MQARLIDSLTRQDAAIIVFDVHFLGATSPDEDAELAAAVERSRRTVLLQFIGQQKLPGSEVSTETLTDPFPPLPEVALGIGPFPLPKVPARVDQIWAFKTRLGDVPTLPVVALQAHVLRLARQSKTVADWVETRLANGLGLSLAEVASGRDLNRFMQELRRRLREDSDLSDVFTAPPAAPAAALDAWVQVFAGEDSHFVNFYGPAGTIATVPADAVLEWQPGTESGLTGKIVFVGVSDRSNPEHIDRYNTVYTSEDGIDLNGVEMAASVLANFLTDSTLKRLSNLELAAVLFLLGTALGVAATVLPALVAVPVSCVLVGLYFGAAQWAFGARSLWMPLALPVLVQLPLAVLLGLGWQYLAQKRGRESIRRAMSYYLPDHVAEMLVARDEPTESGEEVYGICLLTDAENFTTVSEKLPSEGLRALLNEYYDAIIEPVIAENGMVTDVVADSIMCVWRSSRTDREIRLAACRAAREIQRSVERFNRQHPDHRLPTRIGLHAGRVSIGNIGGRGRYAYSLVGDIANTTSRIEGLNRYLGTWVLASEEAIGDVEALAKRRLGTFLLKGKTDPVSVFEIMDEEAEGDPEESDLRNRFAAALRVYDEGRWQEAGRHFADVLATHPDDGPSQFYRTRCSQLADAPPDPEARIVRMVRK